MFNMNMEQVGDFGGAGGGVRVGDIYGAGTRMGMAVMERVKRVGDGIGWYAFLMYCFDWVPFAFWFLMYGLHFFVQLLQVLPYTSGWFEVRKVCRMGVYVPAFCTEYGPSWMFTFLALGAKGFLLVSGTMGMVAYVMNREKHWKTLLVCRRWFVKVSLLWVLLLWILPQILSDLVRPLDLLISCVVLSVELEMQALVMMVLALVLSRALGVPLVVCHFVVISLYRGVLKSEGGFSSDGNEEQVVLTGWLEVIFGKIKVRKDKMVLITRVLETNTQDEFWSSVRSLAYAGDKLAYFLNGRAGINSALEVKEIQAAGRIFDDVALGVAMRYYATEWWEKQSVAMHGKAAATVLEAISVLVLMEDNWNVKETDMAFAHYTGALKRANEFAGCSSEKKESASSEYEECELN